MSSDRGAAQTDRSACQSNCEGGKTFRSNGKHSTIQLWSDYWAHFQTFIKNQFHPRLSDKPDQSYIQTA